MSRCLALLLVAGYGALLAVALSRRAPAPPPAVVQPPLALTQTLTVYYEKDPLPEELYKDWAWRQRAAVVQLPLAFSDGAWPADGDLYIVSPRWLASLQQQIPLRAPAGGQLAREVNPAFTSQPFDADNQRTVPWRWTPWVIYSRPSRPEIMSAAWTKDLKILFALVELTTGHRFETEAECWRLFLENEIQVTLLPASYLEKNFTDPRLVNVTLTMPNGDLRGTIIHLDLLAVAADRDAERQRLADELSRHLLAPEQQRRLVTASGYFPVVSKLGHEYDFAPVPLPKEHWFNRSEFLINRPPQ